MSMKQGKSFSDAAADAVQAMRAFRDAVIRELGIPHLLDWLSRKLDRR